jgi:hypothetical protein
MRYLERAKSKIFAQVWATCTHAFLRGLEGRVQMTQLRAVARRAKRGDLFSTATTKMIMFICA